MFSLPAGSPLLARSFPHKARSSAGYAAAVVLGAASVLTGCGSEPQEPAETVRSFYDHLGRGEFGPACELLDEELRTTLANAGQAACDEVIRELAAGDDRGGMTSTQVDAGRVEIAGSTATIPEDAVTFGGQPSNGGNLRLERRGGRWLISNIS